MSEIGSEEAAMAAVATAIAAAERAEAAADAEFNDASFSFNDEDGQGDGDAGAADSESAAAVKGGSIADLQMQLGDIYDEIGDGPFTMEMTVGGMLLLSDGGTCAFTFRYGAPGCRLIEAEVTPQMPLRMLTAGRICAALALCESAPDALRCLAQEFEGVFMSGSLLKAGTSRTNLQDSGSAAQAFLDAVLASFPRGGPWARAHRPAQRLFVLCAYFFRRRGHRGHCPVCCRVLPPGCDGCCGTETCRHAMASNAGLACPHTRMPDGLPLARAVAAYAVHAAVEADATRVAAALLPLPLDYYHSSTAAAAAAVAGSAAGAPNVPLLLRDLNLMKPHLTAAALAAATTAPLMEAWEAAALPGAPAGRARRLLWWLLNMPGRPCRVLPEAEVLALGIPALGGCGGGGGGGGGAALIASLHAMGLPAPAAAAPSAPAAPIVPPHVVVLELPPSDALLRRERELVAAHGGTAPVVPLWHGTAPGRALGVVRDGLLNLSHGAHQRVGAVYGPGIYSSSDWFTAAAYGAGGVVCKLALVDVPDVTVFKPAAAPGFHVIKDEAAVRITHVIFLHVPT